MSVIELTQENFQTVVEESDILLVDFWAQWCGPCRSFAPVFADAAAKHQNITFGKLNTEEQPELGAAFGIRSIPTLMCFRDRIVIFQQAGALPPAMLEQLIGQIEQVDMDHVRSELAKREQEQAGA